ncbi:MAG: bifunctional tRNA (5-methylaminomethyl-2-thiouridine)(34)-methyltransferase MnmD/FAD-dependent 5-carboxymethylaminomethyl-2-thiouridine(34) oxidoreductase MnmC [Cellvibrionaceae bacterium]|nr:bifunctional tRNA (5-methylaminomethyl-2-thiouridine)(34)-methyltransferase MnmD/FAD-dependent 5-carboxymethylaminomethyl-2-thiouridine(34) oxidoreductase MnmC [Cellvibrionaceae bacterium]
MNDKHTEATLFWDNKGQPHSTRFDDIYFSADNGLEESRYVFLQHNRLAERFRALPATGDFIIGETGFGTGLNFLATWQLWEASAPRAARLHVISVEKYPLAAADMAQAHQLWPTLQCYSTQLLNRYQRNACGQHLPCWHYYQFGKVTLTLIIDEANSGLGQLLAHPHPRFAQPLWQGVDAWFLDGFAPAKNPDMWCPALFNTLGRLSKATTTLSTFTAAGSVKRGLQAAGFSLKKVPGFGRKREMLSACYSGHSAKTDRQTPTAKTKKLPSPWTVISNGTSARQTQKIAVIGAGLAGCHTAYALAQRAFEVTIIDSKAGAAQATSGNPQGVLYTKLSAHRNPLSDFNLACLLWAQTLYQDFWSQADDSDGKACGLLQLSYQDALLSAHQHLAEHYKGASAVHYLDAASASQIANITLDKPGLYFPYCGWLNPRAVCHWLLQHTGISPLYSTQVGALIQRQNGWQLQGQQFEGQPWYSEQFDAVVIANAQDAQTFAQTQWLPTQSVRGQISYLPLTTALANLQTVVCGDGYIAPACRPVHRAGLQTMGASYNTEDTSLTVSASEHRSNQARLQALLPPITQADPIGGRVGLRCTSPDYLPMAGPVAHYQDFVENYRSLGVDSRQFIAQAGRYYPGLYSNIAHGSRGLAYTPLCAQLVAAQISGTPAPVPQAMADALNPGRFIIRDLQRRKCV